MPNRVVQAIACHRRRSSATAFAAFAAVAVLGVAAIAGAKSFTLKVAKNVHVTNTPTMAFAVKPVDTHEAVAVGPSGYAVYTFQGETTHHIICKKTSSAKTNCWAFWPPVSPSGSGAVSKQAGISGKLGTFKNHGTTQLTLNGQPLYYFTPDIMGHNKQQATGDELKTFGSIWHIVKAAGGQSAAGSGSSGGQTSSTNTGTTPYPPGY
jgi:predicted lipoprotein with Yx(FWY)xxD motif